MADEGIPQVKGYSSLTAGSLGFFQFYQIQSKSTADIVSELATQPTFSRDAKRLMYLTMPRTAEY